MHGQIYDYVRWPGDRQASGDRVSKRRHGVICTIAHGPHRQLLDVTRRRSSTMRTDTATTCGSSRTARRRPGRSPGRRSRSSTRSCTSTGSCAGSTADAVVVDGAPDIGHEIGGARFLHLVEHRVGGERRPNAGVMLLRGGRLASRFLERLWAQHQFVHHRWWESAAIAHLLGIGSGRRCGRPALRPGVPSSASSIDRGTASRRSRTAASHRALPGIAPERAPDRPPRP